MGHASPHSIMVNFNGGTVSLGTSLSPVGMYAGYLLLHSGNFWLAICFLVLTGALFLIGLCSLCRFAINLRRNKHLFAEAA